MRFAANLRRALALGAALCTLGSPAPAALRNPQVPVNGTSLQSFFSSVGENINVNTDQADLQSLELTVSSNSTLGYQFECRQKDADLEIGIYNGHLSAPDLVTLFPASSTPGFAFVGFRKNPDRALISLFDAQGAFVGTQVHLGITSSGLAFYERGPAGTFYSQDVRNPGGAPQVLSYFGTGRNAGSWWSCFESAPPGPSDSDFDDAVLFNQVLIGVPVHTTTWAQLKTRFR